MQTLNRFLLIALLGGMLAGCVTSDLTTTITNLTPSRLPRKDNGQYRIEVEYATRQESLLKESMKAYVMVGDAKYPMERTPLLPDRWETLVPIAKDQNVLNYRFRFDYQYKAIPTLRSESRETKFYQLFLLDK
jgi:hypothetical protein